MHPHNLYFLHASLSSGGPVKTIHTVLPHFDINGRGRPEILKYSLKDQEDLDHVLDINQACFISGGKGYFLFDDLEDGGIYSFGGVFFAANVDRCSRYCTFE